ncbi:unnamed protein product [Meloidogyne enterolobii]|uniref:Uncharacterized protein n=1 Tax=Meloidogyne enterolobii TaxID=390850 RepID=A0ACB0Y579_MELEN
MWSQRLLDGSRSSSKFLLLPFLLRDGAADELLSNILQLLSLHSSLKTACTPPLLV